MTSALVLLALPEALLRQRAQLVALAPDQLLGGDLEVADEAADHGVAAGVLDAAVVVVGPSEPAKSRPVRDLVLNHSAIKKNYV